MSGKIETNLGMIADPEKLRDYTDYLVKLIDNLEKSRDEAIDALIEMNKSGFKDEVYDDFNEKFKTNIEYINELKAQIMNSKEYYDKNIELTIKHLDDTF